MPTHASRLTRVGGLRFFSSPMDSGTTTVRVMLRVEVLEDFSLISESASILSSSSELSMSLSRSIGSAMGTFCMEILCISILEGSHGKVAFFGNLCGVPFFVPSMCF